MCILVPPCMAFCLNLCVSSAYSLGSRWLSSEPLICQEDFFPIMCWWNKKNENLFFWNERFNIYIKIWKERGINWICLGFSIFFPALMIACSPYLNILEEVKNKDNLSSKLLSFVVGVCELKDDWQDENLFCI